MDITYESDRIRVERVKKFVATTEPDGSINGKTVDVYRMSYRVPSMFWFSKWQSDKTEFSSSRDAVTRGAEQWFWHNCGEKNADGNQRRIKRDGDSYVIQIRFLRFFWKDVPPFDPVKCLPKK